MTKFKVGSTIRCTDAEFATGRLTVGKTYEVRNIGGTSGRVLILDDEGKRRFYESHRFVDAHEYQYAQALADAISYGTGYVEALYAAPKKTKLKPVSITVDAIPVMAALNKMLKDQYGIDAEVKSVRPRPGRELELILK